MTKPIRLLIDGDVVLYKHMLGLEHEIEWETDIWTLHCDIAEAKESITDWIEKLLAIFDADRYTFALSCSTEEGFRYKLNPDYKSNRKDKRKPLGYQAMRNWVTEQYEAILKPGLEADDVLGILATTPSRNKEEHQIIVSVDKDFRTVPCHFYRFSDPNPDVEVITPEEGERYHAVQTLAGDTVDGYSGCPGIGTVRATKLVDGLNGPELWEKVTEAYTVKGLTPEDVLMNARMAYILQHKNYKKGKVIQWQLPTQN